MSGTDRIGFDTLKEQSTQQGVNVDPSPWHLGATGDFTGDGVTDLVWANHDTRVVQVRFMSGTDRIGLDSVKEQSTQQELRVPAGPWYLTGTGDFTGDGHTDLVWRHQDTGVIQVPATPIWSGGTRIQV